MLQRLTRPQIPTPWIVVNTQPNRELVALRNLARQDFRAYCPMIVKRIKHAGATKHLPRPLFPGYVFVNLDPDHGIWRPIVSTLGVRSLVKFGDKPAPLDGGFILALQEREDNGVIVRPDVVRPTEPYMVGQKVRMNGGPFDGAVATILTLGERDRLLVLLDILKRGVRAQVHADKVRPL
ncbi:MAG: transcriptional activator RfaH [Hyphomicrobiaceae bacterium]|nr:MAG: transcriptional activator RfaH [Hyphomicrobiaceae bacterium]